MTVLVGDLGGTHCRLGLAGKDGLHLTNTRKLRNNDYSSFCDLLADYLHDGPPPTLSAIVIALAAPIDGATIKLTNLDWNVSSGEIRREFGNPVVYLINDLEALGYALAFEGKLAGIPVLEASPGNPDADKLVIGAGTGFNSAAYISGGSVICSETGHSTFPVETDIDQWVSRKISSVHGRCSLDRVLSGSGLETLYAGICAIRDKAPRYSNTHQIIPAALNGEDDLARIACEEFCRIFGRTAGDLSLIFMPSGGVWLAGGMTLALRSFICDANGSFTAAFLRKGRMSDQMPRFGVRILNDDNAGLFGCLSWFRRHAEISLHVAQTEKETKNERIV